MSVDQIKSQTQAIKLVVLDLDGTILRDDKSLDRGLLETLDKLRAKGILFTYATGRNLYLTLELRGILPFELPFAINNGAMIYQPNMQVLASWSIPQPDNNQICATFERECPAFLAYSLQELIYFGQDGTLDRYRQFLSDKLPVSLYDRQRDYSQHAFYKIMANARCEGAFTSLQEQINTNYPRLRFAPNEGSIYALSAPEANKGTAVQRICRELGLEPSQCMVIGDNHNDSPMLELAGLAVAMGNAEADVLALADLVIGSNQEDGVSTFLNDYFEL